MGGPMGTLDGCCCFCGTVFLFVIFFLGATIGIPIGLVYGTNLHGCCIGLITTQVVEFIILLAVIWWIKK
jgi:hypothetical protein